MGPDEVNSILDDVEQQIAAGSPVDLKTTGYWSACAAVKRDPLLADSFADRFGVIDNTTFESWARLVIPVRIGTTVAVIASILGVVLIVASGTLERWNDVIFLAGTGVLIGGTHGLGHLAVGTVGNIRFTAWFIGPNRPQPGVKTDYATYLRAAPRARAWMHASGAIVTKAIPFLLIPVALIMESIDSWVAAVLVILGVVQIVTDALWSTKASDWAKFQREMKYTSE